MLLDEHVFIQISKVVLESKLYTSLQLNLKMNNFFRFQVVSDEIFAISDNDRKAKTDAVAKRSA